jgi:hypothetical protein
MMIFKFHGAVKTEGAVAVACSDLFGPFSRLIHDMTILVENQPVAIQRTRRRMSE